MKWAESFLRLSTVVTLRGRQPRLHESCHLILKTLNLSFCRESTMKSINMLFLKKWGHTGSKLVPVNQWTLPEQGSMQVPVVENMMWHTYSVFCRRVPAARRNSIHLAPGFLKNPVALPLFSPLCVLIITHFLNPLYLQVVYKMVWLAEVGCNRFLCLLRVDVRAVAIHLDTQMVLFFSHI